MNLTLKAFIKKELLQALRDVKMRMLLFGAPIIQLTIFGFALSTEIKNIRLAVFHRPGDAVSVRIAEKFYASGWFVRAEGRGLSPLPASAASGRWGLSPEYMSLHGQEDPFELIASGRADAVLIAPEEGLARSAGRGDGRMQLLVDATNATKARAIEVYAKSIIAAASAREYGPAGAPALRFDVRVLYNPAMESSIFLVPGVMGMLVCLVTIILTAMSITREREMGTFEMIVSAPLSDAEVLLGKTVPFILLGLADAALVVTAGHLIFGVPLRGALWQLALAAFALVVNTVSIGTFVSTIAKNQQQAMLGGFMFLFPAILMSGVLYPVENMPRAIIAAAYLDPLMYFVRLIRNIMLKGGDPHVFGTNLGALWLMAFCAAGLAYKRFRQTLN